MSRLAIVALLAFAIGPAAGDAPKARSAREALKPFNLLVGSWKGTGTPEGSTEERQKGHWTETVTWEWQFKGDDAWLTVTFDKGKYFARGELRYLPARDAFELTLTTVGKEKVTYAGELKGKQLSLERPLPDGKIVERLTFSLLHDNRITYRMETRQAAGTALTKKYFVGLTKEGEAFADVGRSERECIVSGGQGTIAVTYQGKTYYVCCTGCRDEFRSDPAKYVREWEAKRKK
jgi:YHS domain-containing protein